MAARSGIRQRGAGSARLSPPASSPGPPSAPVPGEGETCSGLLCCWQDPGGPRPGEGVHGGGGEGTE